ncbi:LON peptidase substrate-binding domain-containing protein [Cognatishimia sp. SS12]|uniref:LON peptidase substrate-binding domain-containing protein n=1 Tax=Cognatishimia sp. SS12 TaxID=2979465 RepID=UPI0023306654|nr:LON peptidase substrate-binding domain-containing protein [Cognatishimia sp. SS12]MDC0737927.1 LON peptidase substrate-binding domain-containing protein [Cognatishimia sp. SS12]
MFRAADLPDVIPVFPLPGALLLPRARLPLHLFEPRYLAMLEDALKTRTRLIGMVQPMPNQDGNAPKLHDVGCVGRISQFAETEDGRYMITLTGVSRFRILEEVGGFQSYRKCRVAWADFQRDLGQHEEDLGFDRAAFLMILQKFFEANALSTDWDALQGAEDEMLINSLAMLLELDVEDKQAMLEAPTLTERREVLTTLIEFALRGGDAEDRMQ